MLLLTCTKFNIEVVQVRPSLIDGVDTVIETYQYNKTQFNSIANYIFPSNCTVESTPLYKQFQ